MGARGSSMALLAPALVVPWITTAGINPFTLPFFGLVTALGLAALVRVVRGDPEWAGHLAVLAASVSGSLTILALASWGTGITGMGPVALKAAVAAGLFGVAFGEVRRQETRHREAWQARFRERQAVRRRAGRGRRSAREGDWGVDGPGPAG